MAKIMPKNLRVVMIQAIKSFVPSGTIVSTEFDSSKNVPQVRVTYMSSMRIDSVFMEATYSIDTLSLSFEYAEELSYLICDKIQDYADINMSNTEIEQFPVEYEEEGVNFELRTITVSTIIRPLNQ